MTTPKDVDGILDLILHPEDFELQQIREYSRTQGLPEIEVSAQQGKFLELLVLTAKATNALEIGTLAGYSTICIARGLAPGGKITTIEYDPHHYEVACSNLKSYDHIKVINGDALETLATLQHCQFDFVFIDADKERNADYLCWAVEHSAPDATILVDNVIRDGRVLDKTRPEKLAFVKTVGSLVENGRINATIVQTVGAKGWDGFVLAKKL